MTPVSSEIKPALEAAVRAVERAGVRLQHGWPAGFSLSELFSHFFVMLKLSISALRHPSNRSNSGGILLRGRTTRERRAPLSVSPRGSTITFADLLFERFWQQYFRSVDVFLLPAFPVTAFPHDHTEPQEQRTLDTLSRRSLADGKRIAAFNTVSKGA